MNDLPQRKVAAGGIAGALSSIIIWAMKEYGGVEVPAEIAVAITTLVVFGLQYFVPNAAKEPQSA